MKKQQEQLIALAGIYQATSLVTSIAHTGSVEMNAFEASIYSLYQTNPATTADVFDGLSGINYGLERIIEQFTKNDKQQLESTRYALQIIHLEKKLAKKPDMLELISHELKIAEKRHEHFDMLHDNIMAQIANIYSDTISQLQPKIMIKGDPIYLENIHNIHRIRSLLLAAIRASMLWHQKGGSRWQLLWRRQSMVQDCEALLKQL